MSLDLLERMQIAVHKINAKLFIVTSFSTSASGTYIHDNISHAQTNLINTAMSSIFQGEFKEAWYQIHDVVGPHDMEDADHNIVREVRYRHSNRENFITTEEAEILHILYYQFENKLEMAIKAYNQRSYILNTFFDIFSIRR
jgi:uncharacterized protein YprB with RNaseH-like and TPR domain